MYLYDVKMPRKYKIKRSGEIWTECVMINEDIIEHKLIAYWIDAVYICTNNTEYIMDAEIHYFDIYGKSIINHSCFERLLTLLDYQTFCELKRIKN